MITTAPGVERPIFITGDGRSGTTLLRTLLSAHPNIAITPEMHYMRRVAAWGGSEHAAPEDFEEFWRRYTANVRFKDLGVDADRCLELIDAQQQRTFRTIYVAVLTAYRERVGKPRVGDKTPGNIYFLPQLLEWFPDARVVVLQRDSRAVVASKMKSPWVTEHIAAPSLRRGLLTHSRRLALIEQADTWFRICTDILPRWADDPRVLTLPYEALVREPEHHLQGVCQFLGEPYDPTMITGRAPSTVPLPVGRAEGDLQQWRREHHAQTLRPISTDSIDKWRKELSGTDLAVVEARCGRTMETLGYTPATSSGRRLAGWVLAGLLVATAGAEARARRVAGRVLRILRGPARG